MTSSDLREGTIIGGYRIIDLLATGRSSVVYRAEQVSLGRTVALKVFPPDIDADLRERFRHGSRYFAALDHPNAITVLDAGELDRRLYIAMRLVDGNTLADQIEQHGLSVDATLSVLTPIAAALDTAHSIGFVHRDVKPQNILIARTGHPYLLADFGLASVGSSDTREFVGAVDYASPELILGANATPAADTYSLAAVIYQCLTGEVPYPRSTDAAVMHAHLSEPPPRLALRGELATQLNDVLAQGMAKDPDQRFQRGTALLLAVSDALTGISPQERGSISMFAAKQPFEEGAVVTGRVVRIDKDEVLVDIGYKSEGVIPVGELSIRKSVDPSEEVQLGEDIDAIVLTKEDQDGRLIISKKRARFEKAWRRIEAAAESGEPVEGTVIEVVMGGLIIDLGVRGFLPASLVDIRRVPNLDEYLGTKIETKVIELNRSRNNVVLSRRAVLEEERKEVRQQILDRLQPGLVVEGQISNIVDFGAFVDLDGIDGLIHISELSSWSHVDHPSEIFSIGDTVQVKVLDIDRDRQRIMLGLQQTQEKIGPLVADAEHGQLAGYSTGILSDRALPLIPVEQQRDEALCAELVVDPARFRRNIFEHDCLERFEESTGALAEMLAHEARAWLNLGIDLGYFAPPAIDMSDSRNEVEELVRPLLDEIRSDVLRFERALTDAQADLTEERIMFLSLLIDAPDQDWRDAEKTLQRLISAAQADEPLGGQLLADAAWSLVGMDSDIDEPGWPSSWRGRNLNLPSGPSTAGRLCRANELREQLVMSLQDALHRSA